jgi:hypothetical protein
LQEINLCFAVHLAFDEFELGGLTLGSPFDQDCTKAARTAAISFLYARGE